MRLFRRIPCGDQRGAVPNGLLGDSPHFWPGLKFLVA
jgi:hypothetical protein